MKTQIGQRNFEKWILVIGIMVAIIASISITSTDATNELSAVGKETSTSNNLSPTHDSDCRSFHGEPKIN
jgi:hypothetical protein